MALPSIDAGKRIIVAGRTGVGKTTLARWLLSRSRQKWMILNPKHTAGYGSLPDSVALSKITESRLIDAITKNRYVILNFSAAESDHAFMDSMLDYVHDTFSNVGVCVDELYTVHNNGRAGNGLISLLTRGRERKQSFIGLTQRPAWISRFCFSEADYICGMSLNLEDDLKTMVSNTGRSEFQNRLAPREWAWYNVAADQLDLWGPVPNT